MIPVPPQIQRQAADMAYELINTFADRLTLEQRVRTIVTSMYEPDRLGWSECGAVMALWAMVVEVRV